MQFDDDDPPPPPGVTLRDPEDSDTLRKDIETGITGAMQRYVHGYSYGGVRMELADLKYADKEHYTLAEQREALMSDRLLARRLRGTVRLIDEETNKVIDQKKNMTLARVPYLTQRGTFINNGSEFSPVSQSRLLPGAYTRKRDNGEVEVHFNTRPGTGSAMRVTLDPATAQYRLKLGTSDLHAYSVFKDMGVTDEELERRWGKQVLEANKAKYSKDTIARAYNKAIPKWSRDETLTIEQKAAAVREAFGRAQVAESVLKKNLPNLYSREKSAFWRQAGRAVEMAEEMSKEAAAAAPFSPDYSPDEILDDWQSFDFDLQEAVKEASFEPDLSPGEMKETYNSIYGSSGPRLASMQKWPEHWLDDQDKKGWLEWYQNYADGRRSDEDDRQIGRWKSFKARHGSQFAANPTARRAFALKNWAIDPIAMLPEDKREGVQKAMDDYRNKAYMKWYMNRHDFDDTAAERLATKARARGAQITDKPGPGQLMSLALDGFITAEDLK